MDANTMLSWGLGLLCGLPVGILASIIAGVRLSYLQFKSSIAGYRVDMVVSATLDIIDAAKTDSYPGKHQDKYRYSLGVILNELVQKFGDKDFDSNGPWPLTLTFDGIDPQKDRWGRFNEYIRPVIDDINVYAFVARFPRVRFFNWLYDRNLLDQLGKLTELCRQLETVVGELDAAFEGAQNDVHYVEQEGAIYPNNQGNPAVVTNLVEEHRKLHRIWTEWRELAVK